MVMSNLGCHLCLLCFLAMLLIPAIRQANDDQFKQPNKHAVMFVFGDSLNDPGNNNYLNLGIDYRANYWPYGKTFFKSPTGRCTDGRLVLDFIVFQEANLACCGTGRYNAYHCGVESYELCNNPSEFLFFDKFHPTEHANSQLAELFWNGAPNITSPYSFKQLFELDSMIDNVSQNQYDTYIDL